MHKIIDIKIMLICGHWIRHLMWFSASILREIGCRKKWAEDKIGVDNFRGSLRTHVLKLYHLAGDGDDAATWEFSRSLQVPSKGENLWQFSKKLLMVVFRHQKLKALNPFYSTVSVVALKSVTVLNTSEGNLCRFGLVRWRANNRRQSFCATLGEGVVPTRWLAKTVLCVQNCLMI